MAPTNTSKKCVVACAHILCTNRTSKTPLLTLRPRTSRSTAFVTSPRLLQSALCTQKLQLNLIMGLGQFPVWRITRMQQNTSKCFMCKPVPLGMTWAWFSSGSGDVIHSRQRVLLVWGFLLPSCSSGSTLDLLGEDESCVVVIVVVGAATVVIVCLCRVPGLSGGRWFGCGDRGRGSCGLFVSATHRFTFGSNPIRAVFRRSEPRSVVGDILVVCVESGWL